MPSSPKAARINLTDEQRDARRRSIVKAQAANQRLAAERAVDDPATLARAARIVRAALARRVLTPEDLLDDVVPSEIEQDVSA